jgi:hypothetical protein
MRTEDRRKLEVIHLMLDQPPAENISPERAIDAFRDGLIRRDLKEELGRCKPKTIDHLMSLANEWADGEYSITHLEATGDQRSVTLMQKINFTLAPKRKVVGTATMTRTPRICSSRLRE